MTEPEHVSALSIPDIFLCLKIPALFALLYIVALSSPITSFRLNVAFFARLWYTNTERSVIVLRDLYWNLYHRSVFSECYFFHYRIRAIRIKNIVDALIAISSCAGVASLAIWRGLSFVWLGVIAVAQILSAVRHLFPYSTQIIAVDYFYPEKRTLNAEMLSDWLRIDELSRDEIKQLICSYNARIVSLEEKTMGSTYFSHSIRIQKTAEEEVDRAINNIFKSHEEDAANEQTEPSTATDEVPAFTAKARS